MSSIQASAVTERENFGVVDAVNTVQNDESIVCKKRQ